MRQTLIFTYFLCLIFFACKEKANNNDQPGEPVETSPNEALYDEVIKVHDEIMPKMGDIYNEQQQIKEKLAAKEISESEKNRLNKILLKLDSADDAMRTWMHEFKPIPDSVGEEKARTYLEGEMEKIKRVRDQMLEALQSAKDATQKESKTSPSN